MHRRNTTNVVAEPREHRRTRDAIPGRLAASIPVRGFRGARSVFQTCVTSLTYPRTPLNQSLDSSFPLVPSRSLSLVLGLSPPLRGAPLRERATNTRPSFSGRERSSLSATSLVSARPPTTSLSLSRSLSRPLARSLARSSSFRLVLRAFRGEKHQDRKSRLFTTTWRSIRGIRWQRLPQFPPLLSDNRYHVPSKG
ncbi:uncharacterized protein LOC143143720 isoform X1 [Ptiloglossa arizonensis]|uniref:uncharacterized protein LOC143143720 isoform X1 n=1 Tax=Ptiloglossa arizonensis TaxID=3350558 RepID=UPI003FA15570